MIWICLLYQLYQEVLLLHTPTVLEIPNAIRLLGCSTQPWNALYRFPAIIALLFITNPTYLASYNSILLRLNHHLPRIPVSHRECNESAPERNMSTTSGSSVVPESWVEGRPPLACSEQGRPPGGQKLSETAKRQTTELMAYQRLSLARTDTTHDPSVS